MNRLIGQPRRAKPPPVVDSKPEVDNGLAVTKSELANAEVDDDDSGNPIERRYLIRRPKAHQWFENNVLMKASDKERVAGRFELFFDLLYVALIANLAEHLAEEPTGINLAIFIILFTTAWHAWADQKEMANNYYNDDLIQRFDVLWIMALLLLFGNNANYVMEDINYLRITTASYQIIRFTQTSMFLYNSCGEFRHRAQDRAYVIIEMLIILLWIPMYFEEVSGPAKIGIAFAAIVCEELGYVFTFSPFLARMLKLTHRTALDINHENDRYTAFTIIILGEFTYAILVGSPAKGGLSFDFLRAVFVLVIAFSFNAMYIYGDGSIETMHPARRSGTSAIGWLMIHLPLSAGLLIGGHVAASTTSLVMEEGHRWLLGGGLAVGFFHLWVLSYLWKDCDIVCKLVMPKWLRTVPRLAAALILALLPLTSSESVNDTAFVGIVTALCAFAVLWETFGAMERGACIFESWKDD